MPAKPKLGQNFLRDPVAIQRIVAALGPIEASTVVEIGPGKGAITELLAGKAKRLIAIELDRELAWNLQERFLPEKGFQNVTVTRQDVLSFDFAAAGRVGQTRQAGQTGQTGQTEELGQTREPLLVVGNLPYYITSPILLRLAAQSVAVPGCMTRAVLMVQREVADRVTAAPGSRDYGLLSVTLQLYGGTEALFTLAPEAFNPPPQVHSTVFRWTFAPRFAELGVEEAAFITFLKQCFAQKRKTLSNNLRAAQIPAAKVAEALDGSGIPAQARAETLPVEQFAALWKALRVLSGGE